MRSPSVLLSADACGRPAAHCALCKGVEVDLPSLRSPLKQEDRRVNKHLIKQQHLLTHSQRCSAEAPGKFILPLPPPPTTPFIVL